MYGSHAWADAVVRVVCVDLDGIVCQAAVALGMEPDAASALDAAQENSFLARLSLLDPRTLDPGTAEKIADLLDAAAAAGGSLSVPPAAAGTVDTPAESEPKGTGEGDDVAVRAIHDLLRQLVYVDPNANMLANGLRPLVGGPRLSLHSSRVTALQFPLYVRGEDDSVVSSRGKIALREACTRSNPFFDAGVLKYYARAGGAAPPTPWSSRKVIAAAVWYVCMCVVGGVCLQTQTTVMCEGRCDVLEWTGSTITVSSTWLV